MLCFQVILPLLKSDLYSICKACIMGSLKCNMPRFDNNHTALGVVLVSGGYPGPYTKGLPITGLWISLLHKNVHS